MSVAATADAAFVTGLTYSATFPVTANGIQQAPGIGSFGNGFVERFSGAGNLVYATYLTGAGGDTTPAGVTADATDAATVVGSTAASGFPTVDGLVPQILGGLSGFVTKLTPAGDGITWSTFVPGDGLSGVVTDAASSTLVVTGNIALGQFPVAMATVPLVPTAYQSVVRLSADGQNVITSEVLVPGTQSFASIGAGGTLWVSGSLSTPLFPGMTAPDYAAGDTFLLHLDSAGTIDQTMRFGGLPTDNTVYASLTSVPAAPAVSGSTLALPTTLTASVTASQAGMERFDLSLVAAPNGVLPNTLRDVLPACGSGQCSGTAGVLAEVSTGASMASLSLSIDDLPNLTLRNLGSVTATGLAFAVSGYTHSTNCGATLAVVPLICQVVPVTASAPASGSVLNGYMLSESSLTFANTGVGNQSAAQIVTLTNTGNTMLHIAAITAPTDFISTSTCGAVMSGQRCAITVTFAPMGSTTNSLRSGTLEITSDASVSLEYVTLLGTSSAAPLTLSPATLDFGTVNVAKNSSLNVTVENTSSTPIALGSLSTTADYSAARGDCPVAGATLASGSTCTLIVTFTPTTTGSRTAMLSLANDATQLPLTVPLTGIGAASNLVVSPTALAFGSIAIGSAGNGTVTLTNSGTVIVTGIANTITGNNAIDFAVTSPCTVAQLAANQGCMLTVRFTPSSPGAETATLNIVSSDPKSPLTVALSGIGVASWGSFLLTVNGGSSATNIVKSGAPAIYSLAITPVNGFIGSVALTCTPINAAQYAACSILPSSIVLNGSMATATATVTTITTAMLRDGGSVVFFCLLIPWLRRRRHLGAARTAFVALLGLAVLGGCGHSNTTANTGPTNLRYTPAGTYAYQVTASSTTGTPISQTVTLNLVIN